MAWAAHANVGEERVTAILAGLPSGDWHALHDLPVGEHEAPIDHLVIGRGGVYGVTVKFLSGSVWVAPRVLRHNGYDTALLEKAAREAARVSRRLSAAAEESVMVKPVVAIFCDHYTLRTMPDDVAVVDARGLASWLQVQPVSYDRDGVARIAKLAGDPATWRTRPVR